jgi:hypothetical protein
MAVANLPEQVDLVLGGAAVSLLIVFLGALRATLRREEGEAGAFSATAVIGGSVLGAAGLVAVAVDDTDLRALLAFPAATTLLAAAAGILTTGALPRAVGYAGLVAAALQLSAVVSPGLALGAFGAWAALATGAMLRPRGG